MQKSKLGISVGLLGAAIFFACFFGGCTASVILAGYILLFEENVWLKRTCVKAVVLMFGFWVLSSVVALIPDAIRIIDSICFIFDGEFTVSVITKIVDAIDNIINITEKVLFIVLGFKALKQETVIIPSVDSFVSKYMD